MLLGAVHKRRHQSMMERGLPKDDLTYLINLFCKSDHEGGGSQKSQKIDDVFYERPLRQKHVFAKNRAMHQQIGSFGLS